MTHERTDLGDFIRAVAGDQVPESKEAPGWLREKFYELGIEEGSGAIDYWDGTPDDPWSVYVAARVDGQRIEVTATGDTQSEAAQNVLAATRVKIEKYRAGELTDLLEPREGVWH